MANPYQPETLRGMAATNKLQIATLIGDLRRSVELLTADIEHEEMRSGVRNVADPTYPALARSPRARREMEAIPEVPAKTDGQGVPPDDSAESTAERSKRGAADIPEEPARASREL